MCSVLSRCAARLIVEARRNESLISWTARSSIRRRRRRSMERRDYRAAVLKKVGEPLVVEDVKDVLKLRKEEVRIKVHACGVNSSDVLTCRGEHGVQPKVPYVPGFEVAGEVVAVGTGVVGLKAGDRVVALNKETFGGFAEHCLASILDVWKLPPSIDYTKAAALIDAYATAYIGLIRRANIKPEDTVLVTAAAGSLGLAAVDLAANAYQAKVIGVCGTEDKATLVREKGAWSALAYHAKGMVKTIDEVTEGKGVSVIFDVVGGQTFLDCLASVAHEGTVIVAGFASRQIPTIPTDLLLPKSVSMIGISLSHYRNSNPTAYREAVAEVIEMCAEGDVDPHVSNTYTLDRVNDALQFVLDRKSTGKGVINIA